MFLAPLFSAKSFTSSGPTCNRKKVEFTSGRIAIFWPLSALVGTSSSGVTKRPLWRRFQNVRCKPLFAPTLCIIAHSCLCVCDTRVSGAACTHNMHSVPYRTSFACLQERESTIFVSLEFCYNLSVISFNGRLDKRDSSNSSKYKH